MRTALEVILAVITVAGVPAKTGASSDDVSVVWVSDGYGAALLPGMR
jgi:hypothetical protein